MTITPRPRGSRSPRRVTRRSATALSLSAGTLLAAGCQTYKPAPLDLPAHRDAFLSRAADGPGLAHYVATLDAPPHFETGVFDPLDGVSLAEAEALALLLNADLRVARVRAGVTRASADNAGLWEDPSLGVDLVRIIESTPNPWKVFSVVGLTIPISGRLEIEKQRAGLAHAAELARIAEQEWRTRMDVRRAWIACAALTAQTDAAREFVGQSDEVLSVVDAMEQAGELARTEARLFRVDRANAAADLALLDSRRIEAELALKRLMGLPPNATITFLLDGIASGAGGAPADASATLHETSPLMLVSRAEYEVAERTLELEIRKQYPDLHLSPGYGREDGEDQVLFGISLPVPLWNANRLAIAEAAAAREVARASAEAALERLLADLASAEQQRAGASEQRRALDEQIVPLVDAQLADAREVARLGEINTLVLLGSLESRQRAKARLIDARRDEALAQIRVQEIIGPPRAAPATTGGEP